MLYIIENAKSRLKTRFDKTIMLLLNNTWQGLQYVNQTFDEAGSDKEWDSDIEEIRQLIIENKN